MNPEKIGEKIRAGRLRKGMTQLQLAKTLQISDKAVSKWERGCGCPDLSVLPGLAETLGMDIEVLLTGDMEGNAMGNGNLRRMKFYICPVCGNLIFTVDDAQICCCGQKLAAISPQQPDAEHTLTIQTVDGERFIAAPHEMAKNHYLSFVALLNGDTLIVKKQYPEWGMETRLPSLAHGTVLWYCTRHGLFSRNI